MASVSTGVGLISGINIEDIVTKLMDIEKRPLAALQTRISDINSKKALFADLTARLLKLKLDADSMSGKSNVFTARKTTSSNESVMQASAGTNTPLGNYSFTVKSLVQAHQVVSGGFASPQATVGAGTITVEMGNGNLDRATTLDGLNGGRGVALGSIAITDRSGRSATVDLSGALTVQDVLDAINSAAGIGVAASVDGDHIVVTDTTGQAANNLSVQESGGGTTASDLGLLGSVAGDTLSGLDVVSLSGATFLDSLNDGLGVRSAAGLDDFRITRRDGVQIDVNVSGAQSVQDVLDAINNDAANADGKLTAAIADDGVSLVMTDSTGGGGDLAVTALNGSSAAQDLGILGTTSGTELAGGRVLAELNTVLLRSVNGGAGVGAGSIRITNRQGAQASVDLSGARTIGQAITAINAAGINVTASLNTAGTGLVLADSSGGAGSLTVEEVDSTTAHDLGILKSVTSGTLTGDNAQMQYVGENTLLADLNGGKGVYGGSFRIFNRNGMAATVDLSQDDDIKIEDVISEINSKGIGITASINATGDGILLTDTSGGTGTMKVEEAGGTTAADLKILGSASADDPTHIDGSYEYRISVGADDTLEEIAANIEASGAKVSATVLNDGSRTSPYRLGIVSETAGSVGRMIIDTGALGLDFATTQEAQDAVVLYGQSGAGRMMVTSTSNSITGLIKGLKIDLVGTSDTPVNISVTADDDSATSAVSSFVDDWNGVIDKIKEVTKFNTDTNTAGPLLGNPTVMRIEDAISRLVSYNVPGASPTMNRLSRVGVSFLETGRISFDETKMKEALGSQRQDVEGLFTTDATGFGAYASSVLDTLTDEYQGVIKRTNDQYDSQIKLFQEQLESMAARLAKVQERLYNEFYGMEEALANLQTQKTAIDNWPNYLSYSSRSNSS